MPDFSDSYTWIFSGIGVTIGGVIWRIFFRNKSENPPLVNNNIPITINTSSSSSQTHLLDQNTPLDKRPKPQIKILFIDDNHTEFRMVNILKQSGYESTKSVKDVKDLDAPNIVDADIIFVDINGVGTTLFPQDQGLGLAPALKKKYPHKKIVIYSAETTGDRFHRALKEVDASLYKNAEPFQFIDLIETLVKSH